MSNPDLVNRLRLNEVLTPLDTATLYGGGAAGYTDYTVFTDEEANATSQGRNPSSHHLEVPLES